MKTTCAFCSREATRWCDFLIAVTGGEEKSYHTCDLAFCDRHGRTVGHLCVRGRGGCCDTIDYCPAHMNTERESLRSLDEGELALLRSELDERAMHMRFGQ